MKKRFLSLFAAVALLLALIPAAVPFAIAADGDVITFPDPNFEAAVREVIGKPTGAITKGDVADIWELNVSDKNISDLTGIEHFTFLASLYCRENKLTELDISNNLYMTSLNCAQNNIDRLDLSNNLYLYSLNCRENNLTELNIRANSKLTYLDCSLNELMILDLTNNNSLDEIFCSGTHLTELNVKNLLELRTLICDNNQITHLDIRNLSKLYFLDCIANQLTVLDTKNNPELEVLRCSKNQLLVLDVSQNPKLDSLWCTNNFMPDKAVINGLNEAELSEFFYDLQNNDESNPLYRASDWAKVSIAKAITKGFVPSDLQSGYTDTITRLDFCRLAVKYTEYATGKTIDEILTEKGLQRDSTAFTDVTNSDVLAAYALGITSGAGDGKFNPYGQFTRESAAGMIMNLHKAMGYDVENPAPSNFSDAADISTWTKAGVDYCAAAGIMSGSGVLFNPKGLFTREMSIMTFDNMES